MNWLLIPHLGKRTVRGDSNFLLYLDIARYLAGQGDYVHMVVDGIAEPSDLPSIPGVFYMLLPSMRGLSYYNRMALLPQQVIEECARRSGNRFVDVVLTSRPMVVGPLKMALSAVDDAFLPVMYLEPGAEDRLQRISGEDYRRSMAQAWQAADVCVLLTDREKEVTLTLLRKFASGTEIQKFLARLLVNPVSVPLESIDAARSSETNGKFTLFFGARAKEVKNIDEVVHLYDQIYRSGRDVKVVIATPTHERKVVELIGKERLDGNKDIEVHTGLGRAEYLKLASRAQAFVSMSRLEGFPVGFWEQMYMGLIGIFPNRPWALGQLPKEYPFIFSSPDEAFAVLSWVVDHPEEAKAKVAFMLPLIRDHYGKEVVWGALRERAKALVGGHQYCMVKSFVPTVEDALTAFGDRFTFEEFIALTSARSKRMPRGSDARAEDFKYPGNYDFYRYVISLGFDYELVGKGTELVFRRK